ncbi:GM16971 [Drosophila sechellia]|uniref:GM16971 n=1 Tax=Drosophila sechellia TaxID=7238 RepID=B4I621_DROSE|nr:GM16971 [Drosophila sechellia]
MQPASSCTIPTQTPSPTPIPTASEHPAPGIQLQTTSASSGRPRLARQIRNWAQTQKTKNRAFWVRSYLHATRLKWTTLGPDESGYQNTQRQDVKRL